MLKGPPPLCFFDAILDFEDRYEAIRMQPEHLSKVFSANIYLTLRRADDAKEDLKGILGSTAVRGAGALNEVCSRFLKDVKRRLNIYHFLFNLFFYFF
jgi:hypothetical protein